MSKSQTYKKEPISAPTGGLPRHSVAQVKYDPKKYKYRKINELFHTLTLTYECQLYRSVLLRAKYKVMEQVVK